MKNRRFSLPSVTALATLVVTLAPHSSWAQAATPVPQASAAVAAQIQSDDREEREVAKAMSDSQRNTMLLKSKIAETKAEVDLQILQSTLKAGQNSELEKSTAGKSGAKDGSKTVANVVIPEIRPPSLIAIFGKDKMLYATLRYHDGARMDVREGDEIDGGFRVSKITPQQVLLLRDGLLFPLRVYAGDAPTQSASNALLNPMMGMPGGMGGLPMMPSVQGSTTNSGSSLPRLFSDEEQMVPTSSFTPGAPPPGLAGSASNSPRPARQ